VMFSWTAATDFVGRDHEIGRAVDDGEQVTSSLFGTAAHVSTAPPFCRRPRHVEVHSGLPSILAHLPITRRLCARRCPPATPPTAMF